MCAFLYEGPEKERESSIACEMLRVDALISKLVTSVQVCRQRTRGKEGRDWYFQMLANQIGFRKYNANNEMIAT